MRRGGSIIFVGGGLANGLAALRLAERRPQLSITVLEAGPSLGGDHTWCWHGSDLHAACSWLQPLLSASWNDYDVRFPTFERTLTGSYHALRSADFHRVLMQKLGSRVRLMAPVRSVQHDQVELESGEMLKADCVIDGRGFEDGMMEPCGYQKFYGLFITTEQPHSLRRPVLMDASVEQEEGFRFIYTLPWSDTELLVEDTRYSDSPAVDKVGMRAALVTYLEQQGLTAYSITGDEVGSLPIPLHGAKPPGAVFGVVNAGVRAGLFHPTTGYSFPEAVRFADWLAARSSLTGSALAPAAARRARAVWQRGSFCRRLNNMLFMAAAPSQRHYVMAQFYRRDAALIARFYSGSLTLADRVKMLSGRPPVPVLAGIRAFLVKAAFS